jgi:hypothetical protein
MKVDVMTTLWDVLLRGRFLQPFPLTRSRFPCCYPQLEYLMTTASPAMAEDETVCSLWLFFCLMDWTHTPSPVLFPGRS